MDFAGKRKWSMEARTAYFSHVAVGLETHSRLLVIEAGSQLPRSQRYVLFVVEERSYGHFVDWPTA
jgi:hypothetical protein